MCLQGALALFTNYAASKEASCLGQPSSRLLLSRVLETGSVLPGDGVLILCCISSSVLSCAACTDATISVYATASGSRLLPPLALDSKVSNLRCSAHFLMAITSRGSLHVWFVYSEFGLRLRNLKFILRNITSKCAVIKNESLISLVSSSLSRFFLVFLCINVTFCSE